MFFNIPEKLNFRFVQACNNHSLNLKLGQENFSYFMSFYVFGWNNFTTFPGNSYNLHCVSEWKFVLLRKNWSFNWLLQLRKHIRCCNFIALRWYSAFAWGHHSTKTTPKMSIPTEDATHPTGETEALQRKNLTNRFASLNSSVNQLTLIGDWKVY